MKASGNIELTITYIDGATAVVEEAAWTAFDSPSDALETLQSVARDALFERPQACSVVARTSAYPELWAEAYDEGYGPVVTSGTGDEDARAWG